MRKRNREKDRAYAAEYRRRNPMTPEQQERKRETACLYYEQNAVLLAGRTRARTAENRVRLKALRTPCVRCGSPHNIHWHHRDPTTKRFSIMRGTSYSWETIRIELAKCDCLCSRCHYIHHRGE